MRPTRRLKITKSTYRHKVNKRLNKSKSSLGCKPCVSILDMENINEVLRVHKSQRAEGKGAWKVVPKDSCEVYKDRRKRQSENNRRDNNDTNMQTSESDTSPRNKRHQRRNTHKKWKKEAVKKTRRRRKSTRRKEPHTSISSFTITTTSCMSSSEMDYD